MKKALITSALLLQSLGLFGCNKKASNHDYKLLKCDNNAILSINPDTIREPEPPQVSFIGMYDIYQKDSELAKSFVDTFTYFKLYGDDAYIGYYVSSECFDYLSKYECNYDAPGVCLDAYLSIYNGSWVEPGLKLEEPSLYYLEIGLNEKEVPLVINDYRLLEIVRIYRNRELTKTFYLDFIEYVKDEKGNAIIVSPRIDERKYWISREFNEYIDSSTIFGDAFIENAPERCWWLSWLGKTFTEIKLKNGTEVIEPCFSYFYPNPNVDPETIPLIYKVYEELDFLVDEKNYLSTRQWGNGYSDTYIVTISYEKMCSFFKGELESNE